jgi:hypothetical protein
MSTRSWTSRKRKRQIPENKENKESKDEDGKKEEIPEKTEQTSKKTKMSKKDTGTYSISPFPLVLHQI